VQKAISALDAEIIVIDNNSPDDSCAMVQERYPEIRLIKNKNNVGFAKANNQGVDMAQGKYICILNPDTVVAEDTFVKILKTYEELPDVGMLGPKLISGTGRFHPESKRNIPSPLTSFGRLFRIRIGRVKNYYADHIPSNGIGDVDILVGAFILVSKEKYQSVQGFDEDYFMYGEDIDLSYKMKKKGLQNYYIGNVPVIHYKGESTDRNAEYIKRFYGAMRMFYRKHFRSNSLLDISVSVGIGVISIVKSFEKSKKITKNVDGYYLVSENLKLREKISKKIKKDIQIIDLECINDLGDNNIELIFDNDYLTYGEMIRKMQSLKKSNLTFKIRPKGCDYMLGSDSSDGKGEVICF